MLWNNACGFCIAGTPDNPREGNEMEHVAVFHVSPRTDVSVAPPFRSERIGQSAAEISLLNPAFLVVFNHIRSNDFDFRENSHQPLQATPAR